MPWRDDFGCLGKFTVSKLALVTAMSADLAPFLRRVVFVGEPPFGVATHGALTFRHVPASGRGANSLQPNLARSAKAIAFSAVPSFAAGQAQQIADQLGLDLCCASVQFVFASMRVAAPTDRNRIRHPRYGLADSVVLVTLVERGVVAVVVMGISHIYGQFRDKRAVRSSDNLALSWEGCVVSETGEQEYYRQLGGMKKS
ncbi:hypothetical protein NKJ40_11370 [Mesorhizobium sp. M0119]|uniref:hypothetical protein n=1 Tax=unclassified Mesorhizobium TaxID=325217 RepID=UPI003339E7E9